MICSEVAFGQMFLGSVLEKVELDMSLLALSYGNLVNCPF